MVLIDFKFTTYIFPVQLLTFLSTYWIHARPFTWPKVVKCSLSFFCFLSLSFQIISLFSDILVSLPHDHKNHLFDFCDTANFRKLSSPFLPRCLKLHANPSSPKFPPKVPTQSISTQTLRSITDFTECQVIDYLQNRLFSGLFHNTVMFLQQES